MENLKTCKKCGKELPITEFYAHKNAKDGLLNVARVVTLRIQPPFEKREEHRGGGNLKKVYSNPDLASFTPKQLMDELAARGYHASGKVTKDFSF